MILALLLLAIPSLFGCALLARLQATQEKVTLIVMGTTLGIISSSTLFYLIEWWWQLPANLLGALLGGQALIALWLLWPRRAWLKQLPLDRIAVIVLGTVIIFSLVLAPKLLFTDQGALVTSIINAWGDLGWHVANITTFAEGQSVPPENPILAGEVLRYPFLINYLSGLLLRVGADLSFAVTALPLVFIPVIFTLLYQMTNKLGGDKRASIITVLLIFFSGSTLGWLSLREDFATFSGSFLEFIFHLPQDYSGRGGSPDGFHLLNVILAALLPQRSFLFGLALALSVIVLWLDNIKRPRWGLMIIAGIMAGLIPLAHAHTALALIPAILALALLSWLKKEKIKTKEILKSWGVFLLATLTIGLPEVIYYTAGTQATAGSFFRFAPGWTLPEVDLSWYSFWLQNTGFLLPLILLGFLLPAPSLMKVLAAAGLAILGTANIFLFAPWPWDNYKLLVYWLIFTAPLIGWLFSRALNSRKIWLVTLALLTLGFQLQTGMLDIWRTSLPTIPRWTEWDVETQQFAELIQSQVPVKAVVATAPYHNNPAALAGRPVYLGFPGHIWSHGGDSSSREAALRNFYTGTLRTLPEAQVSFVVVGPIERQHYPNLVIPDHWRLVATTEQHQLYEL